MSRLFALIGALLFAGSLVFFLASYGWRFQGAGNWTWELGARPVIIDIALFSAFALHHSIFARLRLRQWIERLVHQGLERSVYVVIASLLFFGVCLFWQPVPGALWHLNGIWAGAAIALQLAGVVLSVVSAQQLDALALAGLKPADAELPAVVIDAGGYGVVRHPIYLGWFLMVWFAPIMNGTRLAFAATSCVYLLIAIPFEERDLRRHLGSAYGDYARRVRHKVLPGID